MTAPREIEWEWCLVEAWRVGTLEEDVDVTESRWELWGRLTWGSCSNDCESEDSQSLKRGGSHFVASHHGVFWLSWSMALISKPDLESQRMYVLPKIASLEICEILG